MTPHDGTGPRARDLVDMRLLEAMRGDGCPVCAVRTRSERSTMDTVINERVLDRGFRAELERTRGFCRRHVAELVPTDRRESGGILGSSILLGAVLDRRIGGLRGATGARGRDLRARLKDAHRRPACLACSQGSAAVETALARLAERCRDETWAPTLADAPFCLDHFLALWAAAGSDRAFVPVADAQMARLEDLRRRLEAYAHHSSQDRRHLLTEEERSAADEATRVLGGDRPAAGV